MSKKIDLVKSLKEQGVVLDDDQTKVIENLSSAVEKFMVEQKTDFETALTESIGTLEKDDNNKNINLVTQLKSIAEAVELLKTNSQAKVGEREKFMLKALIQKEHKNIVEAVKEGKKLEFTFKVAAMHMTNNGTVTNAVGLDYPATDNFMVESDIAKIRYADNFLLNYIPNTQSSKVPAQIIRKEQATTEGAVAVTAEGAVKPLLQYKFVRTTTSRKKYAGRIEWTEEFEMDFEALFREIVLMFEADVVRAWQDGLLDEIIADAAPYVSSVLDGTLVQPDNGLAIVAAQSQLNALNYYPDLAIMNPADVVTIMFSQDSEGNLRLSPYIDMARGTINGMRLVTTNKMDVGTALVLESKLYREIHSDFILRTGQYNAQLIENEYTAIGEIFSILRIAERDLVGVVELDLAAVRAALQSA